MTNTESTVTRTDSARHPVPEAVSNPRANSTTPRSSDGTAGPVFAIANTGRTQVSSRPGRRGRGQTTLPALAVALVIITTLTGLSFAIADMAITSAERSADERRAAASIASHLVDDDGPLADRSNVLNQTRLAAFDDDALRLTAPPAREYDVRVSLDGTTVAQTGNVNRGVTIRRLVLLETAAQRTLEPNLTTASTVTVPRRTGSSTIEIDPPNGTTIWTVRANDRVVLHNSSGLSGTFTVRLVPYETTRLRFAFAGAIEPGNVTIRYDTARTTKATLAVSVDA